MSLVGRFGFIIAHIVVGVKSGRTAFAERSSTKHSSSYMSLIGRFDLGVAYLTKRQKHAILAIERDVIGVR